MTSIESGKLASICFVHAESIGELWFTSQVASGFGKSLLKLTLDYDTTELVDF